MKISISWLKEYIHLLESPLEIATILTNIGLEVGRLETFHTLSKANIAGLVIGEVVSCSPHPNADRLRCTQVSIGIVETLPIVCGAPTVSVGQKVVVAPVGVTIYPYQGKPFKIARVTLRGIVSEGMICAEDEIGWGPNHETILILQTDLPAGTPLVEYVDSLADHIFNIELTPNRIEAASHVGVARELRAVLNRPLQYPILYPQLLPTTSLVSLPITVHEPDACRRYAGIVVDNIQIKPSPDWLQHRLRSISVNPINNVVDITHFILHELGQPMHAFDYNRLPYKEIHVRKAYPGEQLVTLDQVTRTLSGQELVIADAKESIALAGVLGGNSTAIHSQTTTLFLESAYFDPSVIRNAAKYHKLQTEASFYYERGTDPMLPVIALRRAYQLIHELAGGELAMHIDYYPKPIQPVCVSLTYDYIYKMIGHVLPVEVIHEIVTKLDMELVEVTSKGFIVAIPPYRVDVTRPADVVEEILRIYGYDRVATPSRWQIPFVSLQQSPVSYQLINTFNPILVSYGCQEICTNPLTDLKGLQNVEQETEEKPICLLNPLSDKMTNLRTTLVFSGLEAILYNINRKQTDLKFFEWGKIYYQRMGQYVEQEKLGIWLTGNGEKPSWLRSPRVVTFQDLNALLYYLLDRWPLNFSCCPLVDAMYQQAVQWVDEQGRPFVMAGELGHTITDRCSIHQPIFFAEIDPSIWGTVQVTSKSYQPVSKFPPVKRDLSLVLDQAISFEAIKQVVASQQQPLLKDMQVFDVYYGPTIPPNKKAYALSFILEDQDKTLDELTIRSIMDGFRQAFQQNLGALIRE